MLGGEGLGKAMDAVGSVSSMAGKLFGK